MTLNEIKYKLFKDGVFSGYSSTILSNYECVEITEEELLEMQNQQKLLELRKQREEECFSIINRGQLWYNTLTDWQLKELDEWYKAWLNITDTKIIPESPTWLK